MDVSKISSTITGSQESVPVWNIADITHYGHDESIETGSHFSYGHDDSIETVKKYSRMDRSYLAQMFLMDCTFDSVKRTFICPADTTYSWPENSYGLNWVAVHGLDDSICVVTRHRDLDMTHVGQYHQTLPRCKVLYALTEAIMSEIEGLPYDDDFRERFGQSIKKPFGVVSVIPVTKESDEGTALLASSVEYDENKAINFLMEKMKSESEITFDETIKTAISAFQHLCLQELKAEEFWVTTWKDEIGMHHLNHLHVHEIEEHLAVINGVGSRKQTA